MSRWTLVLTVFLAACGKSEAVVAYEELAAAVCKCTDEACARQVGEKFEPRLARFAKEGVQAKDGEAINEIAEKITACAARLVASAPPPSQDGESGKPPSQDGESGKPSVKVKLGKDKAGEAKPSEAKPSGDKPAEAAPVESKAPTLPIPPPGGEPTAPTTPPAPPTP